VVIGNVSARGVRAVYLRDAKGVRNIDDLVSAGAAPAAGAGSSGAPSSGARFDVSSVRLEDVRLRVRDQMADLAGDIVVVSLTTGRLANRAESPVTLRATAQLTRPQPARLTLDGHTTLALDLDKNALGSKTMEKAFEQMQKLHGLVDANSPGRDWNLATAMVINGKAGMQIMCDWAKGEFLKAGKKPNVDFYC